MRRLGANVVVGLVLLSWPSGASAVLCKKRSGAVFERSACKKKELPLTADVVGPPGPAGSDATIDGVPAGGDLTGTFPAPTLADGVVTPAKIGTIPQARAQRATAFSVPSGITTDVPFSEEAFDTQNLWDPGAPACMTTPIAGVYLVTAQVRWQTNAVGTRFAAISYGPRVASSWVVPVSSSQTDQNLSTIVKLPAGTCVNLIVYQTSGGALELQQNSVEAPNLAMSWLGPG